MSRSRSHFVCLLYREGPPGTRYGREQSPPSRVDAGRRSSDVQVNIRQDFWDTRVTDNQLLVVCHPSIPEVLTYVHLHIRTATAGIDSGWRGLWMEGIVHARILFLEVLPYRVDKQSDCGFETFFKQESHSVRHEGRRSGSEI